MLLLFFFKVDSGLEVLWTTDMLSAFTRQGPFKGTPIILSLQCSPIHNEDLIPRYCRGVPKRDSRALVEVKSDSYLADYLGLFYFEFELFSERRPVSFNFLCEAIEAIIEQQDLRLEKNPCIIKCNPPLSLLCQNESFIACFQIPYYITKYVVFLLS